MVASFSFWSSSLVKSFVSSSESPAATRTSLWLVWVSVPSPPEQLRTQVETPTITRTARTMASAPRMTSLRSMPRILLRLPWKLMLRERRG